MHYLKRILPISFLFLVILFTLNIGCSSSKCPDCFRPINLKKFQDDPCCFKKFPISYSFDKSVNLKFTFYPKRVTYYPYVDEFVVALFKESPYWLPNSLFLSLQDIKKNNEALMFFKEFSKYSGKVSQSVGVNIGKIYYVEYFLKIGDRFINVGEKKVIPSKPLTAVIKMLGFLSAQTLDEDTNASMTVAEPGIFLESGEMATYDWGDTIGSFVGDMNLKEVSPFVYERLPFYFYDLTKSTPPSGRVLEGFCYWKMLYYRWKCVLDGDEEFDLGENGIKKVYPVLLYGDNEEILKVLVWDDSDNLLKYTAIKYKKYDLQVTKEVVATSVKSLVPRLGIINTGDFNVSLYFMYATTSDSKNVNFLDWELRPITTTVADEKVKKFLWIYTDKEFSEKDFCYITGTGDIDCPFAGFKVVFEDSGLKPIGGYVYYKWGNNPYEFYLIDENGNLLNFVIGGSNINRGVEVALLFKVADEWFPVYIRDKVCCSRMVIAYGFGDFLFDLGGLFPFLDERSYLPFDSVDVPDSSERYYFTYSNGYYWPLKIVDMWGSDFIFGENYCSTPVRAFGDPMEEMKQLEVKLTKVGIMKDTEASGDVPVYKICKGECR